MIRPKRMARWVILSLTVLIPAFGYVYAQQPAPQTAPPNPYLMGTEGLNQGPRGLTSYMPVAGTETFAQLFARLTAAKPGVEQAHTALLNERYDTEEADGVLIAAYCQGATDPLADRFWDLARWMTSEFPPEVLLNVLMSYYQEPDHAG